MIGFNREGVVFEKLRYLPEGWIGKILDAGSGITKPYAPYLERIGEVTYADIRAPPDSGIILADVRDLPFAPDEFDLVVCFEVLEHLDSGWELAVEELRRVSKGEVVISYANPEHPMFTEDPGHEFGVRSIDWRRFAPRIRETIRRGATWMVVLK